MAFSPYTPGTVSPTVPGRTAKLSSFREAAQRMSQLDQFVPRIHVDHGPRGIGKTSLLREGERIFSSQHIRSVWITADRNESLLHSLLSELAKQVGIAGKVQQAARKRIQEISIEVGVPAVGHVAATMKSGPSQTAVASAKKLIEALGFVLKAAESDGDSGLVILIDEIQEADEASLRTISYAWQEMASSTVQPRAALFAVGLPGASAHINKAVSFSERFDFEPLPGLDDGGVSEALIEPARSQGVTWAKDALHMAVAEAEGYPYKVQLIGDSAWRAGSDRVGGDGLEPGHVITRQDLLDSRDRVDKQMDALFRARWSNASPKQREMLIAIAELGGENVKRSDLADKMKRATQAISVPRQRILDKGIVDANKHGHLSFTIPGFSEFALAMAADE